jgi:hypothetical protein
MSKNTRSGLIMVSVMMFLPFGFMIGAAKLGINHGLGLLVGYAVVVGGGALWYRRNTKAGERRLEQCRKLLEAIEQGPIMDGRELEYQKDLVRHFLTSLEIMASREQSLPSGTKVDVVVEYHDADWYVTLKRGLDNQQRLTIQGEIEDILLHVPRGRRDLWIVVVVGVDGDAASPVWGQLKHLLKYTLHRPVMRPLGHYSSEKDQDRGQVFIEIVPVPMSSPLVAPRD